MKNIYRGTITGFLIIFVCGILIADQIETFKWYPVKNKLEHNGIQYSDSTLALQKDTAAYFYFGKIDPGYVARAKLFSVMHIQARVAIQYRAVDTAGTPANFRWWLDGRDTLRSVSTGWQLLCDTQNLQSTIGTTYNGDTLLGYIKLDSVRYLPAMFRVGIKSDSVNDSARVRIINESYFDVLYKILE